MNDVIYELQDYHFRLVYNDRLWLTGKVYGRPGYENGSSVYLSTPKSLDGDILTTYSGSRYRLINAGGIEEVIRAEINKVISQGHYSYGPG